MNPDILRIIDANCNRSREALRVLEDYARFSLNDAGLSGSLKALRHEFQVATAGLQRVAVSCRDTAGDVGTGIRTETEQKRESIGSVVTAACKRLGEALRTIEEYAKAFAHVEATQAPQLQETDQGCAQRIEALRYRFYDIEKQLLATLTPGRERVRSVRLCVLITAALCRRDWLETARLAIEGGADMLQLREKSLDAGELLDRANRLVELCRAHGVVSIINDRPDVAVLAQADGVHVGQTDLPVACCRRLVGPDRLVGLSTHDIAQARLAVSAGADYIGVGPMFSSTTKPQDSLAGLAFARSVAGEVSLPALAISGINAENVVEVCKTGIVAVAVSSAVIGADDPREAARAIKACLGKTT